MNFLESLAAEWYSYQKYFIRTNVRVMKREKGGWGGELDILAYSPKENKFIHIETSGDALRLKDREARIRKKFDLPHKEYERNFHQKVDAIKKIAIVGFGKRSKSKWGDIEVKTIREFMLEIWKELSSKSFIHESVPENFPLLRTIQMAAWAIKGNSK